MTKTKLQRAVESPAQAVHYLWRQTFKVVGHRAYKKFIVLGRMRIGSSMLLSFLAAHPNIYNRGELFQKLNGRDHTATLTRTFSKQPPGIKAVGFKIFYNHPHDDTSGRLWADLVAMPELHVIHLQRKNTLRTIVSEKIARKTGHWKTITQQAQLGIVDRRIELDYADLKQRLETIKRLSAEFDEKFATHPKLSVYYEDLVSRPDSEFGKVLEFLGLPFYPPQTQRLKQNPERLSRLIVNYEQLKDEFADTEWASLFDEEIVSPLEENNGFRGIR
ncbi:MAG: sulfotransferase [Anaerolineae bacterium]|nr:sulfotransferase [Anaerolineae bacterium]